MDTRNPGTIVYVRGFKPLSVTFPAPGVYTGLIRFVLPDPDDNFLNRLGAQGAQPVAIDIEVEGDVTAETLRNMLAAETEFMQSLIEPKSSKAEKAMLHHLSINRRMRSKEASLKLISIGNPLESTQD